MGWIRSLFGLAPSYDTNKFKTYNIRSARIRVTYRGSTYVREIWKEPRRNESDDAFRKRMRDVAATWERKSTVNRVGVHFFE